MTGGVGRKSVVAPCELFSKRLVPAIRAAMVIIMVREYGLTAYRAAKILGITPAAASNYVLKRRGSRIAEVILGYEKARRKIAEVVERAIVQGSAGPEAICEVCRFLRKTMPELREVLSYP
ncbi:MAG: hypothetical protein GXO09_03540 [Crenarchaeota archaeon]|nr:hypothetical protein [Thermoproteota archaeon]